MSNTASSLPKDLLRLCEQQPPQVFLVLGSGYGSMAEKFQDRQSWPFSQLPEISAATVPGHKGCLTHARFRNKTLLISEGRIHSYEGYPKQVVTATKLGFSPMPLVAFPQTLAPARSCSLKTISTPSANHGITTKIRLAFYPQLTPHTTQPYLTN